MCDGRDVELCGCVARALDDNSDGVGGEWSLIKAQQWQPIQYTSLFDDDE